MAGNAFQQTMLGLEFDQDRSGPADLFSQACVEQYDDSDPSQYGYLFAQVFEPQVLLEVAALGGVDHEAVTTLVHRPTATLADLADAVDHVDELAVVGQIHLTAALVSISRFDVAARVLTAASARAVSARDKFEIAMLDFVIRNRRDDGTGTAQAFRRMRAAIETGTLPPERVLDACAQGVVWYFKRRELAEADYEWYLAKGADLADRKGLVEPAALSSWYRGIAMVPAARGEVETTRRYMEQARVAASMTLDRRNRPYELHLMKTYHESSLKEHLYLNRDLERVEESGRALIDLDPAWSPSYGELAEAYVKFGRFDEAAGLFDQAASIGPPYVGYHELNAARCHDRLGNDEQALSLYLRLVERGATNEDVVGPARRLAVRTGHPAAGDLPATLPVANPA